jgi:hypothetical protein
MPTRTQLVRFFFRYRLVQVRASEDTRIVSLPTAIYLFFPNVIPVNELVEPVETAVQVNPFVLVRIVPESPTATKRLLPYTIERKLLVVPLVMVVQVCPSVEYRMVPVFPTATNPDGPNATSFNDAAEEMPVTPPDVKVSEVTTTLEFKIKALLELLLPTNTIRVELAALPNNPAGEDKEVDTRLPP